MRVRTLVGVLFIHCGCDAVSGLSDFAIVAEGAGGAQSAASTASTVTGSGGAGGDPDCPSDDFEDGLIAPEQWVIEPASDAFFTEAGGVLVLDVTTTIGAPRYARLLSAEPVSLASCAMKLQVLQSSIGDEAGEEFYFSAIVDGQNSVGFILQDGFLSAGKMEVGLLAVKSVSYDAMSHRWWRFRAQGPLVMFQTSSDGINWTSFHEESVGFSLTTTTIGLAGGATNTSTALGGSIMVDNYNTPQEP